MNKERNRCGFGLLAQNTQLDAAAKSHPDYLLINNLAPAHEEYKDQYPSGFTGANGAERVLFQGYTGAGGVTDEFNVFFTSDPLQIKTGFGEMGIRSLLNAPYHMGGLVAGYRDVGVAVRSNADTGGSVRGIFVHVNAAYKTADGKQILAAEDVKTYPCDGASGVDRKLTGESPNPVPGRVLSTSPLGSSVYVALREGKTLTIASASMVKVSDGAAVTLRAPVTASNDPYGPCASGCFKSHEGYVAADAPLEAYTNYRVVIAGTNDGVAFTRNFIFTTGK